MAKIEFEEKDMSTLEDVIEVNESELKNYIVDYVGSKLSPEGGQVNVGMVVDVLAEEFPEFVLAVAEENWIRGYEQALADVDTGKKIAEEIQEENEQSD